MEAAPHEHQPEGHPAEPEAHTHGPAEDWNSEAYVAYWLGRQGEREAERRRQFVTIRAFIPHTPEQEFTYLNLGAGPGNLDEVLLEQFRGAQATLVDGSLAMLNAARQRLSRFGERVEYVQADLSTPGWAEALGGPFDLAVSTIAIHNLRQPQRIRELYAETYRLLGHGGVFFNLDYLRPARSELAPLGPWAARDAEAGLQGRNGGGGMPGTLTEQLGWLGEAGFACVDVLWKELSVALMCGIRDHLHMPAAPGEPTTEGHDHAH